MAAPDHFEVAPYPQGRFRNGHFTGERLVECASSDVAALLDWFDTYPNDLWPYPFGGWSETAMVTEADVDPKPGGKVESSTKPLISYNRAYIKLKYSTEGMMNLGGYHFWEHMGGGLTRSPQPKPAGLLWNDGTPLFPGEQDLSCWMAAGTYHINHFKLATAPSSISSLARCCNSAAYTTASLGLTFAPQTLLFAGAALERGSPGAVTHLWKMAKFTFHYNPNGWNNVWRPETGQFEAVYLPTGDRYYFQPPAVFTWTSLRT